MCADLHVSKKITFLPPRVGVRGLMIENLFYHKSTLKSILFSKSSFRALWQTFTAAQTGFILIQSYDLTVCCDAVNKRLHQMLVPSRINPRRQFSVRDKYYASCFIEEHNAVIELY